jgi:hypothetical protein
MRLLESIPPDQTRYLTPIATPGEFRSQSKLALTEHGDKTAKDMAEDSEVLLHRVFLALKRLIQPVVDNGNQLIRL